MRIASAWRGWLGAFGALLLAALVGLGAAAVAERRTLAALRVEVRGDARLRAALLDSEVARFRLLPLAMADDREVEAAVGGDAAARAALDRKLESLARTTGAAVIYVVDRRGVAVAASNWRTPGSFVGTDFGYRRYVRDALARGHGEQFALGAISRRPGLFLARRSAGGGAVVVKLEFDRVERAWATASGRTGGAGDATFVHDANGVVLVTSRPRWRFAAVQRLDPGLAARVRAEMRLPPATLRPLPSDAQGRFVVGEAGPAQPGWTLIHRRAAGRDVAAARLASGLIAALVTLVLAALGWAVGQRARLARRRTAELETAVAERTAALRREMAERAEGEARAAELREALRQANRLAALGQITASVAHETAQPVAAIRTYAQTGAMLLDRGALDEVRDTLSAVARLADRIGTVTEQLRGFARRKPGAPRPVSVAAVLDGARLILKEQLRAATLEMAPVDPALSVIGGKVRLEQVLVNLIQNALEATAERDPRVISLRVETDEEHVRLTIADNGPGIAPEVVARLFTPFVTSRPAGLGLGLVIAQDIMTELGGWLRLVPSAAGAAFEVGMRRA